LKEYEFRELSASEGGLKCNQAVESAVSKYYHGPRILLYVYGVVWCCAVDWCKVGGAGRSEGVGGAWNGCVMERFKGVRVG
jgi:hypothetical protein